MSRPISETSVAGTETSVVELRSKDAGLNSVVGHGNRRTLPPWFVETAKDLREEMIQTHEKKNRSRFNLIKDKVIPPDVSTHGHILPPWKERCTQPTISMDLLKQIYYLTPLENWEVGTIHS